MQCCAVLWCVVVSLGIKWCVVLCCSLLWCVIRCGMPCCVVAWRVVLWSHEVCCSVLRCTHTHGITEHTTAYHSTHHRVHTPHNIPQRAKHPSNTPSCRTTQHSYKPQHITHHNRLQHSVMWCGVVWCGGVSCDRVAYLVGWVVCWLLGRLGYLLGVWPIGACCVVCAPGVCCGMLLYAL